MFLNMQFSPLVLFIHKFFTISVIFTRHLYHCQVCHAGLHVLTDLVVIRFHSINDYVESVAAIIALNKCNGLGTLYKWNLMMMMTMTTTTMMMMTSSVET
jgi:hypothetical protein